MKTSTKLMLFVMGLMFVFSSNFEVKAQYLTGDVFIAVSSGNTQWRRPDGTLIATLNNTTGGYTTGMSFDENGNLYVTDFSSNAISVYDNFGVRIGTFGSGYSTPEMIVFDSSGNAYVTNVSGAGIRKYSPSGTFIQQYATGRSDFCDLSADQCVMLYTQEGPNILRYNVCTDASMTDFASGLGGNAYALRIRPNGEVLLANGGNVLRLNSSGSVIQTYDVSGQDCWFALNLDPDNVSFWSADFCTADVFRIDIATGAVIFSFNTGTGGSTVYGLGVRGEITAATFLTIDLDPPFAINPINTQHCVTAEVLDNLGVPRSGETVDFTVRGANGVLTGSGVTNASGEVDYCYIGTQVGCDTIFGVIRSNGQVDTAIKCWDNAGPVELSSFNASVTGKDVMLNWSTTEEINNSGFDIERKSIEGKDWTKIGFVEGNGTSSNINNYSFTDKNLNSGKYNYRLKQIDFNGHFEYFNLSNEVIVGVPDKLTLSQNYPNPFNPSTKIAYELPGEGNVKLIVYDNRGKMVATISEGFKPAGYYTVEFNAVNLASGIYFYKLQFTSGNYTSEKVMKMTVIK